MNDPSTGRRLYWPALAGLCGALLLCLAARTVIDHLPIYDELLHYLSAQGLRATGRPAIAGGFYTRAGLFTALVAQSCTWFGTSLVSARLPSLAASMVLAFVLAFWVGRRVGIVAAFTAAAVLCLLPITLELSVFIRFYTLHALLITLMAIAAYEATSPSRKLRTRVGLALLALLLVPLAWHLQPTTLIAVLALGCAAAATLADDHRAAVRAFCRGRVPLLAVAALVVLLLAAFAATRLNLLGPLREVPLWAAWAADDPLYYAKALSEALPLLWPLLPLVIVLGLATHRRLSLYCSIALLVAFLVHSIAAAKSMRYVYYALPLLCVLWACAIDGTITLLRRWLDARREGSGRRAPVLVMASALLILGLSTEGRRLARPVLGHGTPAELLSYASEPDWTPIVAALKPLAQTANHVVTSNSMKAIYYLGRYDYELNASIVVETDSRRDFGRDERTGGQAISAAASVARVIGDGTTLVVLEDRKLDSAVGVPGDAHALIMASCAAIPLPAQVAVHAWHCDDSTPGPFSTY